MDWYGAIEDMPLNSLGMLKKIGHPSYKYLEWKQRSEILVFTTNYWPIVQGSSDEEALEFWKDIGDLLELDKVTWYHLILLVHQGVAGRACANKLIWNLLTQYAIMSHCDLNKKAMSMIAQLRKLIDRPPAWSPYAKHWTIERALQPLETHEDFAAEAVPEDPGINTGTSGEPLAPPHCWPAQLDANRTIKDAGIDRRRSRKHHSWRPKSRRSP